MTVFIRSALIGVLILAIAATGEEVSIPASKDNSLWEDPEGATSDGSGAHLFVGKSNRGQVRRALIAFDIAAHVPANAVVTSATLSLNMSKTVAGPQVAELHRVLTDWDKGSSAATGQEGRGAAASTNDATWLHSFFDTELWDSPGGDFVSAASANLVIDDVGPYTWESTPAVVMDVQGWLVDPDNNFGWIVLGNEESDRTAKRFDSRENSEGANNPMLIVEFDPPASNGTTAVDAKSWGRLKRNSH